MPSFENKLDEALGLINEEDAKPVELGGKKKKSADGVHRPDKPTEHTEAEFEGKEFENHPHEHSDQARPGLSK